MKKLSIEEKAKRYDEILAMAKECITYIPDESVNKYMLNMFPELAEPDDERIRKNCIHFLELQKQHHAATFEIEECIAWLEKQGKQNAPYVETSIKDGVYLVYEDFESGKRWCEVFTGYNNKENAIGVAFKFGKVALRLYNGDIENCNMLTKKDKPCDYVTSFDKAACDFEGLKKTEMLLERGLSCRNMIPDGWYIPSIGELNVMYIIKEQLNAALKYIYQDIFEKEMYWSSTEYSATSAWNLNFSYGYFNYNNKSYNSFRVRPVSEFNPLTL